MNRKSGLSAMLRVKNEEQLIGYCIHSIIDWFDELVICLQNCTDGTEDVINGFDSPKIKVHHYDTDNWPNGPGYQLQDATDKRSRTYFYNWCLDKTNYTHVCKWDADMVAMDFLGDAIHKKLDAGMDFIKFHGINIVDFKYTAARATCPTDGVFKVSGVTRYVNGVASERLNGLQQQALIREAAYLHFKWSKPFATATQAWPEGWEQNPHFKNVLAQGQPVTKYKGEWPTCLKQVEYEAMGCNS